MFGFLRRKTSEIQVDAAFEKISLALSDDDFQLRILGPKEYAQFSSLTAIDQHYGAEGEFGTSFTNPIPTNGPIGSLCYLSHLKLDRRHRILFHRIREIDGIDVYEFVTLSGKNWGFMFIDMYHSRKSRISPKEFVIEERPQQLCGFNHYWDDFPFGFAEQKAKMPRDLRLLYCSIEAISKEMEGREYVPPQIHMMARSAILGEDIDF